MTLLALSGVNAFYGSSQALFDVDLTVDQGEVVALMGRNGMGKSTTIRCVCKLVQYQGDITFDSVDLAKLASYQAARLGIGLVPEGRRCFADLTVYENLVSAARSGHWTFETVSALFPRLGERRKQKATSLSGGEQQMLAIGRALMTNPRMLLLDEATEGLAPIIRQEIWTSINSLKTQTGLSILVVDKSVSELRKVCDSAVLLEKGRTVWRGAMNQLTTELTEKFVGVSNG